MEGYQFVTPREYLFHLERHGIKLGLDNIRYLLDWAGAPQEQYPTVHVAGTNGKGSVVAFLDAMARAAGYRVGRFTSPHLLDVTERFVINGCPISGSVLNEHIEFFRGVADRMSVPPTFFELNTAIAFRWFAQSSVDLAIIEVGMGGRLDSTNVIQPLVTAITNIALDHTQYLGDTLEQIAFEKAGILKLGVPLILGETEPPARDVILARAAVLAVPVSLKDKDFRFTIQGSPFDQRFDYESPSLRIATTPLALAGVHQGENAALAVAVAERLAHAFPRITPPVIATGLSTARWPCRLEQVIAHPPVIVDVAHNPAGARQIARALSSCVVLLAVSSDKDAARMIEALRPIASTFIVSQYHGTRSMSAEALSALLPDTPHHCKPDIHEAIQLGLGLAGETAPLLITGSIFTAGEAREILVRRYGAAPLAF